jgi:hypothetical protein
MNDTQGSETGSRQRKPYHKPELGRVELRQDEAVLGHCKISNTSGPATANCGTFTCSSVGS